MTAGELVIAAELGALAGLYLLGVARLRSSPAAAPSALRAVCFMAGLAALWLALVPLERAGAGSLTAHMVQHLVLLFCALPLLVAGAPHRVLLGAVPGARAPLARALGSRPARLLTHPAVALATFVATLLVWHIPAAYDAALASPPLHAVEHAAYLLAGLLLWLPLLAAAPRPRRLSPLASVLYLLLAMLPGALIGIALMTAGEPLYGHYAGLTLDAQREAGMVMWAAGTLALATAAVAIGWLGVEREERRQRARERSARLARTTLMVLCAAGAITVAVGSSERSRAQDLPGSGTIQVGEPSPLERQGRELFEEGCSDCHGLDARGIEGRGPTLYGAGEAAADFNLRTGRMPLDDPDDEPARTESPYEPEQIDALVAYVGTLGEGPEIPTVDPERGSLNEGKRLFTELCAGCHQVVGQGGIATDVTVPDLQVSEPLDVAEAVRIGPYVMPRFERLEQGEVDSLARYVAYTRDPEDRGGWGIGHIGPIPEGMVAWLLAGAALLLAIRLIGERTTR